MRKISILFVLILVGCGGSELSIPKPPTYLRLDLPEHSYKDYQSQCGYHFLSSEIFTIKNVSDSNGLTCHKDIDLGPLNGVIHFSFIDMIEPESSNIIFMHLILL